MVTSWPLMPTRVGVAPAFSESAVARAGLLPSVDGEGDGDVEGGALAGGERGGAHARRPGQVYEGRARGKRDARVRRRRVGHAGRGAAGVTGVGGDRAVAGDRRDVHGEGVRVV